MEFGTPTQDLYSQNPLKVLIIIIIATQQISAKNMLVLSVLIHVH